VDIRSGSRDLCKFSFDLRMPAPVLCMILLNCIMILILIPYGKKYHDTDT